MTDIYGNPTESTDPLGTPFGNGNDYGTYTNENSNLVLPSMTQSQYDFTYRIFPENLGNEENNHYMILNINIPMTVESFSDLPSDKPLEGEYSKVDTLRYGSGASLQFTPTGVDKIAGGGFFGRTPSKRIASSIALHMPQSGLVFTEFNKYEEQSMTALGGSIVSTAAKWVDDGLTYFGAGGATKGKNNPVKIAEAMVGGVTGLLRASKFVGTPVNPMVEVIFATKPQRQWTFEVLMAPRTANESRTIREIIQTIRYYAAPEVSNFWFLPPAEFDITFFRNGQENKNLPRINTCVLERIDVDYAPGDGVYSTFSDGSPVAVRLSLGFRELEINHKKRVLEGF